jgi:hypothetical protein
MVDVVALLGLVGSPVDVATLVVVLFVYRARVVDDLDTIAAALVLLAKRDRAVSDERLADELDVEEDDLDDVRPVMAHGPKEDGSRR